MLKKISRKYLSATALTFVAAASLTSLSGCAHSSRSGMHGLVLPDQIALEPLRRQDYRVVGPAKGDACYTTIGLWPLPIVWHEIDNPSGPGNLGLLTGYRGYLPESKAPVLAFGEGAIINEAVQAAVYEAIGSVPSADAMILPRYTDTYDGTWPWYSKNCVTVQGKAIEIIADETSDAQTKVSEEKAPAKKAAAKDPSKDGNVPDSGKSADEPKDGAAAAPAAAKPADDKAKSAPAADKKDDAGAAKPADDKGKAAPAADKKEEDSLF